MLPFFPVFELRTIHPESASVTCSPESTAAAFGCKHDVFKRWLALRIASRSAPYALSFLNLPNQLSVGALPQHHPLQLIEHTTPYSLSLSLKVYHLDPMVYKTSRWFTAEPRHDQHFGHDSLLSCDCVEKLGFVLAESFT